MADSAEVADALAAGARRWRRRRIRRWTAIAVALVVLASAGLATWAVLDARQRALAERAVTGSQQSVIAATFSGTAELAARIESQRTAYRDADALWDGAVASAEEFRAEDAAPAVSAPNPGGQSMPGGDAQARSLLDGIGGSAVQIVYDGGAQNCGFAAADATYRVALGGCYDSSFRNRIFLAWDPGATRASIWPIFVHEAMHWYQWDRYSTQFAAAEAAGIGQDAYSAQLETDASCRAVIQHGVPARAYELSSAPCTAADWHDGWLLAQLAALGVPVAAPVAEEYEVQQVVRP
jgi:hypothetical protein